MKNNSSLIESIEVAEMLGFGSYQRELPQQLEKSIMEHFGNNSNLIFKDKVTNFLKNHTNIIKFRDEVLSFYKIKPHSFETKYRETLANIGVRLIIISNRAHFIYISHEDYEKAIEYYKMLSNHPGSKLLTKQEIAEKLDLSITSRTMVEILKTYNITPYVSLKNKTWYHLDQVNRLKLEQQIQIQRMDNYVSCESVANQVDSDAGVVLAWVKRNNIKTITPPPIAKIKNYANQKQYILKKFADQYFKMVEFRQKLTKTFQSYNVEVDSYITYLELLKLYGNQFADSARITNEYWDMFIREKLNSTIARDLEHLVHQYALLSRFLMNIVNLSGKELFQFSTKELNFALLNDNVPYTYKTQFYSFINKIHQGIINNGGQSMFDLKNLRSPKKERKKNHIPKEKEIYKPNIYIDLTRYCSDVQYHSKQALEDAKNWRVNNYSYYSNMWVYVLIQLTNCWRHSDVIEFPRFDLYQNIELESLLSNPISYEDARIIVAYYENKVYIHNKNQQDRYLIVSDDLACSFATSILISEYIQRLKNPLSNTIFDFGNKDNKPTENTHKAFFKGFPYQKFQFENRKMNWTVMTLATDIISKITKRNPLEIAKFLRNHSDPEITNIYIQLPEEYVKFITRQLFNLGSFGYIYDGMAKIMLDQVPEPLQHDNALFIKKVFHQPSVVEGIAKHISKVIEDKNYVINTLKNIPKGEIETKLDYLNLGLMPSKKDGYQCLLGGVSNCPYKTTDCERCLFNVPTRFALCSLAYDLEQAMDDMENFFELTSLKAEKIRLANRLYVQLSLLKTAIEKLGRNVVNQFIPGGLEKINDRLTRLPASRSMVSSDMDNWLIEKGINAL